jgi:hypothetical protein
MRTPSTIPSQLPVFGHPNNKRERTQTLKVIMQVSAASCYFIFLMQIFSSKPSHLTYTYVEEYRFLGCSTVWKFFIVIAVKTLNLIYVRSSTSTIYFLFSWLILYFENGGRTFLRNVVKLLQTKWRHLPEGGTLHNFDLLQLFLGHIFPWKILQFLSNPDCAFPIFPPQLQYHFVLHLRISV